MLIRQLMNRDAATVATSGSCSEAARIMRDRNVGFLVVTDRVSGKVAGVVTDRDICMAGLSQYRPLGEIPIIAALSKDVHTCRDDDDLVRAHAIMRANRVRRLPVLDGAGNLLGIVSLSDLARAAAGGLPDAMPSEVALTLTTVSPLRVGAAGRPATV
jgi:CBS domain-containing protein